MLSLTDSGEVVREARVEKVKVALVLEAKVVRVKVDLEE